VGRSRRLVRVGACSCCGGLRLVADVDVVVAVRIWERAGALGGAVVLWCRCLVGDRAFGWVGRRVWRRVFGDVLVMLCLAGLEVGGSRSLVGVCLEWRCWCLRGSCRVVGLGVVARRMCLLVVGIKTLWFFLSRAPWVIR
jgi:hypothetical protein